jgi:streptomycin 6-kinase
MHRNPETLSQTVGATHDGAAWLRDLPERIAERAELWALSLGAPIEHEASCSWVAPCTTASGEQAVLKLGYPHMEARDEIEGLKFWAGEPTALLLRADEATNAMLLERCEPGDPLRGLPEHEQDEIIAALLRRLWREPRTGHPFRPLTQMIDHWCGTVRKASHLWADDALVNDGLDALADLARSQQDQVLLATDLHAGNVLRAQRLPWLVIDPKPFIGDPCYDATQHLLNCMDRMHAQPVETVARLAGLLDLDEQRLRQWTFARFAVNYSGEPAKTIRIAARLAN